MAAFIDMVVTVKGGNLIAKLTMDPAVIEFTKVVSSSAEYTVSQLNALESIDSIQQTVGINRVELLDGNDLLVETLFNNRNLTIGYQVRAVGLYAMDPDEGEILYGVTIETSGQCYIPASGSGSVSGLFVQFTTGIGENGNVSVNFNQAGEVSIADINRLETLMGGKVDKADGMGLSHEDYTPAEKEKLAGLESSHFRGTYVNAASLTAAIPIGIEGDYAYVGSAGQAEIIYVWDHTDSIWVQGGGATAETPASVKQKYESNPDTNAYTDAEKAKLRGLTTPVEASLTQKGIVQLSNSTTSTDETMAATPKAVNDIKVNTALTGIPTAPTPSNGDHSTRIATTQFMYSRLNNRVFIRATLSEVTDVNGTSYLNFTQNYQGRQEVSTVGLTQAIHGIYGLVWKNSTANPIYVMINFLLRFSDVSSNSLRYIAIDTGLSYGSGTLYENLLYFEEWYTFKGNECKIYTCVGAIPAGGWIVPSVRTVKGDVIDLRGTKFDIVEI